MAKYFISDNSGNRIEGTFEEMKSKLSELVEGNRRVSDKKWEEIQLLEPKGLPLKVAGMTFFKEAQHEQNSSRTE